MEIGKAIRKLRTKAKLTQQQLAQSTGLAPGHIAQIETGVIRDPGLSVVAKLAGALGVSIDQLVGEKKSA